MTLLIQYLYYPAHTISLLPRSYKIFYYPAHTISLPILTYLASIVFVSLDIRLIPLSLANSAGFHPSSYQGSSAKLFLASLSLSSPHLSAILRIHPAPCIVYVPSKASFSCHLLWLVWNWFSPRAQERIQGGARTQSFHTFQILNWREKNIKKLVCCSFRISSYYYI